MTIELVLSVVTCVATVTGTVIALLSFLKSRCSLNNKNAMRRTCPQNRLKPEWFYKVLNPKRFLNASSACKMYLKPKQVYKSFEPKLHFCADLSAESLRTLQRFIKKGAENFPAESFIRSLQLISETIVYTNTFRYKYLSNKLHSVPCLSHQQLYRLYNYCHLCNTNHLYL